MHHFFGIPSNSSMLALFIGSFAHGMNRVKRNTSIVLECKGGFGQARTNMFNCATRTNMANKHLTGPRALCRTVVIGFVLFSAFSLRWFPFPVFLVPIPLFSSITLPYVLLMLILLLVMRFTHGLNKNNKVQPNNMLSLEPNEDFEG